jgi:excisionase family DNA binding protein
VKTAKHKKPDTIPELDRTRLAYSIDSVCEILGVGRTRVHTLIAEGRLRAVKVGRRTLVLSEDLRALLRMRRRDRDS